MRSTILLSITFATTALAIQKCIPGHACFPSKATLDAFNSSVSGVLYMPPPYGNVCYDGTYNAAACSALVTNKQSPEFRETLLAAVMYPNNEFDQFGHGCPVPNAVPSAPLSSANGSCVLGSLATYIVNATSASQVMETVKFAALHNLKLVIKNSGHDYFGRSTEAGGFTIRTLGLKEITHIPNFTPENGNGSFNVVAAGAGNNVGDLYEFAEQNNILLNGGYDSTVGACGGFWMHGGIGTTMGPLLGFGADRVVQFDIVLAGGNMVTANTYQNADLFWAVRGGGGAFGVVTKVWLLAGPAPVKVNTVFATATSNSTQSFTSLVSTLMDSSPSLRGNTTTCLAVLASLGLQILCINVFPTQSAVRTAAADQSLFDPFTKLPGVTTTVSATQFDTFYQAYQKVIGPIVAVGAPVGINLLDTSRLLNETTLTTQTGRDTLKKVLLAVPEAQTMILEWNAGGKTMEPDNEASVNPLWRQATGYLVSASFDSSNGGTSAAQNSSVDSLSSLYDQTLGIAAYPNEDNIRTNDYQTRYWGTNYPKLRDLKKKYDPTGVFICKHCVGSELFGDVVAMP